MHRAQPLPTCLSQDAQCVRAQLLGSAVVRVKCCRQPQPYGSTVAIEELPEAELVEPWVVIPLETDTIPVDLEAAGFWSGVEIRVRFFHPQVRDGKVTYDAMLV